MTTTQEQVTRTDRRGDLHAVRLRGVSKRFGDVAAVRGVDLTIGRGEIVAFLGPNGAGKTTTLDMILGLARPTVGTVEVLGGPPEQAIRQGLVAAVMQTGGLLKELTVAETVAYTASLFAQAIDPADALARAGLTAIADRKVAKTSGGEQQRLRFAMALVSDPALLLLDEPTTGMDVSGRRAFWEAIRADTERGRTVLFATHYLEEADAYADRVVLVNNGAIVADGSAAQIRALASGRTIQATLPDPDLDALRRLPGVEMVEVRGASVRIHATDTDTVARELLTRTAASGLEITSRALEDAFVALTTSTDNPATEGGLR